MDPALLLFDIDGTLLHCGGAGMRAMAATATRLYGPDFKWDGIDASGHLDPLLVSEALALNRIDHDVSHHAAFRDHYLAQLELELQRTSSRTFVMPGIHDLLAELRRRGDERGDVVLGLLTGNYSAAVPLKLAMIDVDPTWFTITAFGDEAPTRADLVQLAISKYKRLMNRPPQPHRVIVVGDTPRDIACAHAHGCMAFAVATGGYSVPKLEAAGADVAVSNLVDPQPLLRLIDSV